MSTLPQHPCAPRAMTLGRHFLVALLLVPTTMLSQGTIQGFVGDSLAHTTLIGANVFLVGTALGNAADREGKYRITNIPRGSYTLRVSYIGYKTKEIAIAIEAEETKVVDVQLAPDAVEISEMVVTAQARGQLAAINQQITSNTIVSVVSEEKIKELPDANAAEAIGRLPGVSIIRSGGEATQVVLRGLSSKFSSITIDGAKVPPTDPLSRDVDLSTISQGSLVGVELYKALTPDKDADAIAGSVNLVTKKAPSERFLRLTTKGAYNALQSSAKQYDVLAQYGERFFDDLLGIQLTGNAERRIRSNEQIQDDYGYLKQNTDYEINNFHVRYNDEFRKRDGLGAILDINTPDSGSVKLHGIFNRTNRDYFTFERTYPVSNNDVLYSIQHVQQEISTFNSSIHGTNYLFGVDAQWGLSYARSRTETPFNYYLDFLEPSSSTSGMKTGVPSLREHPELLIQYAWNNYVAATCSTGLSQTQDATDKEVTMYLDLERKYNLSGLFSGAVKFGGKYREKKRSMTNGQWYAPYYLGYWKETNRDGSVKALLGTRFERFYKSFQSSGFRLPLADDFIDHPTASSRDVFDKYTLTPLINRDALDQWYALNINGSSPGGGSLASEYYENPLFAVNDYDVTEGVGAGYLMNTLHFGPEITLITGARTEREKNEYHSFYVPGELTGFPITGTTKDTTATYNELVWLPNLHLTVRPTDYLSFRIAAYRALGRPDFDLRLVKYGAQRSGSTSTLILGNPGLKTSKAWNYEVNTSVYSNTIGLISVSAFYKEVDNFVHELTNISVTGDSLYRSFGIDWKAPSFANQGYTLTVPYNSPKPTTIYGLEFEHQTNLRFLPGILQNLVLTYNFSISRSETYILTSSIGKDSSFVVTPRRDTLWTYKFSSLLNEQKQRTEGHPEFFANCALGYDLDRFSVRLSMYYQSNYNRSFSATGLGDRVVSSFTRWDLALKYDVTDNVTMLSSINNLTNVYESVMQVNRISDWNLLGTQSTYGLTADLGVRITL